MPHLKHLYFIVAFVFVVSPGKAQNVLISHLNAPNEPSIMMDPKNPAVMVAAANIHNVYVSKDTGRTWKTGTISSSHGVWGDPSIAVDTAGNFYYFHLSHPPNGNWIDRIVCQKSTNQGITWTDGSYTGLNGKKAQDKQWFSIDPKTNYIYITWTQFDKYDSKSPRDSSIILFSRSADGGASWSEPKRINQKAGDCRDDDNTVEGAVSAVGPNGEIYVVWAGENGLVLNRSLDKGETWLEKEIPITATPGGWNYRIPGLLRCNGLPVLHCDLSNGPRHGTLYLNWSDQYNGPNNTDVWLASSTDGGNTWSTPARVNDDEGDKHQFMSWMTVDQSNGNIFLVYYDRRKYRSTSTETDVYVAASTDGGKTFANRQISESPFMPDSGVFFGDYTNITAYNGIVRPIWTRLNNGILSVWTDLSTLESILSEEDPPSDRTIPAFEDREKAVFPFTYFAFKIKKRAVVDLRVYNTKGESISTVINHESLKRGKYRKIIDLTGLPVSAGSYFLLLEIDGKTETRKQFSIR